MKAPVVIWEKQFTLFNIDNSIGEHIFIFSTSLSQQSENLYALFVVCSLFGSVPECIQHAGNKNL